MSRRGMTVNETTIHKEQIDIGVIYKRLKYNNMETN